VTGGLRKLHEEDLHNFYSYDQVKEDAVSRPHSKHGEMKNAYRIWVGKPEGKRLLG
jgi:hypothetical protein